VSVVVVVVVEVVFVEPQLAATVAAAATPISRIADLLLNSRGINLFSSFSIDAPPRFCSYNPLTTLFSVQTTNRKDFSWEDRKLFCCDVVPSPGPVVYTGVSAQSVPVELMATSAGEHAISELEDIDALVRLYRAKVFRFVVLSISDRDAAESITQDCFLKAYGSRTRFRGDCSVSTWLMRIAFNLVRDHTKSLRFRFWKAASESSVDAAELSQHLPSEVSSPEEYLLAKERVATVSRTLKDLSAKQRMVFVMRFVEDMDLPEIAAATGMPVPTVKTHLYRAVSAVRSGLGGRL